MSWDAADETRRENPQTEKDNKLYTDTYMLCRVCGCIEGGSDAVIVVRGFPERHAQQRGCQGG